MSSHKKEIRQLAFQLGNPKLFDVASRLPEYSNSELKLLRRCLKLEKMRREGKEFVDD